MNILIRHGLIAKDRSSVLDLKFLANKTTETLTNEAQEQWAQDLPLFHLVQRFGSSLAKILIGETSPLELLFPGGSFVELESIYRKSTFAQCYNGIVETIIRKMVHQLPQNSQLRILEIGGGTGGTSEWILPALPEKRTMYMFTDISPSLIQHAKEKFKSFPFVRYHVLDIQKEPKLQDVPDLSFDLVIASNVLHAVSNLGQALKYASSLLAPGGMLLLWEITRPQAWFDITFGMALTTFDDERSPDGLPFLMPQQWREMLGVNGFENITAFPDNDSPLNVFEQHILIAQKSKLSANSNATPAFSKLVDSTPPDCRNDTFERSNREKSFTDDSDPWLGQRLVSAIPIYQKVMTTGTSPLIRDHKVFGKFIIPGAALIEMMMRAVEISAPGGSYVLSDINLLHPISMPEKGCTIQTVANPEDNVENKNNFQIGIFQLNNNKEDTPKSWTSHAGGSSRLIAKETSDPEKSRVVPSQFVNHFHQSFDPTVYYGWVFEHGLEYGETFKVIDQVWIEGKQALASLKLRSIHSPLEGKDQIRPVLLDSCFQVLGMYLYFSNSHHSSDGIYVPFSVDRLMWYGNMSERLWCHAELTDVPTKNSASIVGNVVIQDESGSLIAEIFGIRIKTLREDTLKTVEGANDIDQLLYQMTWQEQELPPMPDVSAKAKNNNGIDGHILLVDNGGNARELKKSLEGRNDRLISISKHHCYENFTEDHYGINLAEPEQLAKVLKIIKDNGGIRIRTILCFWSLDFTHSKKDMFSASLNLSCEILSLVQALVDSNFSVTPKLFLITRGSQPIEVNAEDFELAPSPLMGLAKVISLEHPELRCTLVDLDPLKAKNCIQPLVAEINSQVLEAEEIESQIAYRLDRRYVARLIPMPSISKIDSQSPTGLKFQPESTYLIAGGFGGLGNSILEWMVGNGARHLVIVGRNGPTESMKKTMDQFIEKGVNIVTQCLDISVEEDLRRAILDSNLSMPPLRGIVHAAGVLDDGILLQQNRDRFERVFRPKILGAWNLHNLTKDMPVDFFVLFSSAASFLGSPGQGNHAGANAFLDALAQYRHLLGLPALSINWGPWSRIGAASDQETLRRLQIQGMKAVEPEQGRTILNRIFSISSPQFAAMSVDWEQLFRGFPNAKGLALLSKFRSDFQSQEKVLLDRPDNGFEIHQILGSAHPSEMRTFLFDFVAKQVAEVIGYESHLDLNRKKGLTQLGLDSLMAVGLRNRLQKSLALNLPSTIVFDFPTLDDLVNHLFAILNEERTEDSLDQIHQPIPDSNENTLADDLSEMSEDEAEKLLLEKLKNLETKIQDDEFGQ